MDSKLQAIPKPFCGLFYQVKSSISGLEYFLALYLSDTSLLRFFVLFIRYKNVDRSPYFNINTGFHAPDAGACLFSPVQGKPEFSWPRMVVDVERR